MLKDIKIYKKGRIMESISSILTKTQSEIVKRVIHWYYVESYDKPYYSIGGVAGSGKSFLVKYLIKLLRLQDYEVLFVAFTGKAALRLRLSGNNANTIHSTFYRPYELPNGEIKFARKSKLESNIKLIVADEAGMIGELMMMDILSFGIPVIILGDPMQLDPILARPNPFMKEDKLDSFLNKPMRFANHSGILDLSILARENKPIPYGKYKESQVVHFNSIKNKMYEYDIVICYRNATRKILNTEIRRQLGYEKSLYPLKGEKIICLKNNYRFSIFYNGIEIYLINGLIGIMIEDSFIDEKTGLLHCKFVPDFIEDYSESGYFDILCYPEYFSCHYDPNIEMTPMFLPASLRTKEKEQEMETTAFLTFAYCISLHKFQGSDADNVMCIIDDHPTTHPQYPKFVYTGITRAKKSITVATFK